MWTIFCIVITIVWTIASVNAPTWCNATHYYANSSRNSWRLKIVGVTRSVSCSDFYRDLWKEIDWKGAVLKLSRIKYKRTTYFRTGFWKKVCLFHCKFKRNIFVSNKALYHGNNIAWRRCGKRSIRFTNTVDMMFPWCCWNMR